MIAVISTIERDAIRRDYLALSSINDLRGRYHHGGVVIRRILDGILRGDSTWTRYKAEPTEEQAAVIKAYKSGLSFGASKELTGVSETRARQIVEHYDPEILRTTVKEQIAVGRVGQDLIVNFSLGLRSLGPCKECGTELVGTDQSAAARVCGFCAVPCWYGAVA